MTEIIEAPQRTIAAQANTPSAMLMLAVQRGDDMERIKQLMDLQDRWEASEALKAYNRAFSAFKAEAVVLVKNRKVTDGPLKGKGYAELHAVVNAITPALSRHDLSASWKITKDEAAWIEVTCTLKHAGGHFETVSMGGPPDAGGAKNAIQARASTVSYLERYTVKAITGLSEQDDDTDARTTSKDESPTADEALIDAGRAHAMNGSASLTKWWGSLSAEQRKSLTKDFAGMKRAAGQADEAAR